jgi:hypothetical protein
MVNTVERRQDDFSVASDACSFDSLADDLRARVKGELEPGERLLWAARSQPPFVRFGFGFYAMSAISSILLVLGTSGIVRALGRGRFNDGSEMALGMVLVVVASLFGIGLIGNWYSRIKRRTRDASVCYAITDRRAVIWTPESKGNAIRISTFPRGEIRNLVRLQTPDGSGSLLFNTRTSDSTDGIPVDWYLYGFRHVHEVRRVEQIVRNSLITGERLA